MDCSSLYGEPLSTTAQSILTALRALCAAERAALNRHSESSHDQRWDTQQGRNEGTSCEELRETQDGGSQGRTRRHPSSEELRGTDRSQLGAGLISLPCGATSGPATLTERFSLWSQAPLCRLDSRVETLSNGLLSEGGGGVRGLPLPRFDTVAATESPVECHSGRVDAGKELGGTDRVGTQSKRWQFGGLLRLPESQVAERMEEPDSWCCDVRIRLGTGPVDAMDVQPAESGPKSPLLTGNAVHGGDRFKGHGEGAASAEWSTALHTGDPSARHRGWESAQTGEEDPAVLDSQIGCFGTVIRTAPAVGTGQGAHQTDYSYREAPDPEMAGQSERWRVVKELRTLGAEGDEAHTGGPVCPESLALHQPHGELFHTGRPLLESVSDTALPSSRPCSNNASTEACKGQRSSMDPSPTDSCPADEGISTSPSARLTFAVPSGKGGNPSLGPTLISPLTQISTLPLGNNRQSPGRQDSWLYRNPVDPPPKKITAKRQRRWDPPQRSQVVHRIGGGQEGSRSAPYFSKAQKPSPASSLSGLRPECVPEVSGGLPQISDLATGEGSGRVTKGVIFCDGGLGARRRSFKTPKAPKRDLTGRDVEEPGIRSSVEGPEMSGLAPELPRPSCSLTFDPSVRNICHLSEEERAQVMQDATQVPALVLTMVYQDGSTLLDPEQKPCPPVSGLLILLKKELGAEGAEVGSGLDDSVVYLRLEQRPIWAQQERDRSYEHFTREMVLHIVSGAQLVVCYKAKDVLRTALQHFRGQLSWKQVARCRLLDPQIAAWMLDPADSASNFQVLLAKHRVGLGNAPEHPNPARKPSHASSRLSLLYRLTMDLHASLQTRGLWELFSNMELSMVPVLAAMESYRIHVDKEALKRTSEMLGTTLKQLEQEAHRAAGEQFLVSSSTQLRQVLFQKLRLQERCENRKLPRTLLKQQQSTSEAVLLQLQDLHPLPKIVLQYRQVHKIKSTFVDGILSCVSKNFVASTWNQTSTVSGRLSAKHPNFQALPRQPVQITQHQSIQGKAVETVTVHPRTMFVPQEGWTFLAADFCQVELRLLAHLSCDPELLRVFQEPTATDVFTVLASQWKGIPECELSPEDREHAKRIVYSVVYGAGRERLSRILGVSAEQASAVVDSFLQRYRQVQGFVQRTIQQCQKQGYVASLMGRQRFLPHIQSPDWGMRNQAERQAVNFVVQGSAADLCKMAMIRIFSQVSSSSSLTARLIAQIHDELLFEVEDSQVMEFAALVKTSMESLRDIDCLGLHLKVPLKVALSRGRTWGSMCELNPPSTPP